MINLSSFIRYHATRTPQRTAIVYKDRRISFAEFYQRIEKAAGYLAARGIGPNDVVAVMMKNSAAFLELAFATSHLGAGSCRSIFGWLPTRSNTSSAMRTRSSCSRMPNSPPRSRISPRRSSG